MKSIKTFVVILPVLLAVSAFGPVWLWLLVLAVSIIFILSLWGVSKKVDKHPEPARMTR